MTEQPRTTDELIAVCRKAGINEIADRLVHYQTGLKAVQDWAHRKRLEACGDGGTFSASNEVVWEEPPIPRNPWLPPKYCAQKRTLKFNRPEP